MFNRVTLPLICALAVALSLAVPVCSFADDACAERVSDGFANEYDQGSGSYASSWRYGNPDAYGEGPVSRCLQTGLIRGGMRAAFGMALTGR